MPLENILQRMCLPQHGLTRRKLTVLAAELGMPAPTLYGKLNGTRDAHFTVADVVRLTEASRAVGNPPEVYGLLLTALCVQSGYLPPLEAVHSEYMPRDVLEAIAREIEEHADVPRVVLDITKDGKVTRSQLRDFQRELGELLAAVTALVHHVAQLCVDEE